MQHIFPEADLRLPSKKTLTRKGPKFVDQRRKDLENYMRQVLRLCALQMRSPLLQNPCKATLCEALPFLKERVTGG